MQIDFWGVRGSTACCGAEILRYGGNTSCISVTLANNQTFILDAGSGLRNVGTALMKDQARGPCTLVLSHAHWDHLQGLPFFAPLYQKNWDLTVCAPAGLGGIPLETLMRRLFDGLFFPVTWDDLPQKPRLIELPIEQTTTLNHARIRPYSTPHSMGAAGYRIEAEGNTLFYSGDHELGNTPCLDTPFLQGMRDADVAIVDAQYTANDYPAKAGWGHSAMPQWVPLAQKLQVKHLVFTHFDPDYSDSMLDEVAENLRDLFPAMSDRLIMGHEGLGITLAPVVSTPILSTSVLSGPVLSTPVLSTPVLSGPVTLASASCGLTGKAATSEQAKQAVTSVSRAKASRSKTVSAQSWVSAFTPPLIHCFYCDAAHELSQLTDISHTLDSLLTKARSLTHADAGTLYLVEEDRLAFAYSQNETLFTASQWARQQYLNASLPLDTNSIAGFAALNGITLNIPNVRNLPADVPYSFNADFDKATGYNTVSMCVVPLHTLEGHLAGVMQLINCMEQGEVRSFTKSKQLMVEKLSAVGVQAIERDLRMRDMILRMQRTAALRDPTETAGHAMRVGAMVAELYHRWAEHRGLDAGVIRHNKAQLRLASMLHDVGKVGISDLILKKPGRLTPEERAEMETHCIKGALLFPKTRFAMDALACEIALYHHQKWNGQGYTGDPNYPALSGEDIPISARLTAIADVFDALVSPRSYKEPWPIERAFEQLRTDAGSHFDPEIVQAFMDIKDTMVAIGEKYKEAAMPEQAMPEQAMPEQAMPEPGDA